jgi:hypothetical protein
MAPPNPSPPAGTTPVATVRLQNIAQSCRQSAALMAAVGPETVRIAMPPEVKCNIAVASGGNGKKQQTGIDRCC